MKNLLPLIFLAAEMGNVADKMGRSKGAARYVNLMDLFDEAMSLGKVDFQAAKEEIKNMDAAAKEELKSAFKAKFDIVDDKLENVIEESIQIASDAYALIERSKALYKGLKGA